MLKIIKTNSNCDFKIKMLWRRATRKNSPFYLVGVKDLDRLEKVQRMSTKIVEPHKKLINKMSWYGLRGNVLGWLTNFLLVRKMRVCGKGSCSDWCSVTSSVPLGSVCRPTQFSNVYWRYGWGKRQSDDTVCRRYEDVEKDSWLERQPETTGRSWQVMSMEW